MGRGIGHISSVLRSTAVVGSLRGGKTRTAGVPALPDVAGYVDYDSPIPPSRQVAEILRGRIDGGELRPGARLPSITALVQEFGIARTTAQKVLKILVNEGVAEVSRGMGTFVRKP